MSKNLGLNVAEKKEKNMIVFITGTSGAGKSTLKEDLEKLNLPSVYFHDSDEWGVPDDADENWRRDITKKWVEYALGNLNEGKSTVILGQSVPREIAEVLKEKNKEKSPIYFGFIDIKEETIKERLKQRKWDDELIEANVNWAKHLRKQVLEQENNVILDGENNSREEVANFFKEWIISIKSKRL